MHAGRKNPKVTNHLVVHTEVSVCLFEMSAAIVLLSVDPTAVGGRAGEATTCTAGVR